ncbi:hypothetical protein TTHERM_01135020 (macronuclear) [Tetrahymena thermophila SB210]|uniref:Cell surface immobilization antigen n=1 Tax=Tetrahymena thermophila (strain SB210) TaxID=312017 RepID=Q235T7_TETTS|nr:hypothetical protein TTHERM_01135020 [Tetrahymena thermophila SB210]EAR92269.2 hypothetical protein TTHERM_01135020 [Tetrahymena thermophila SB210]|eukprot:XP_001012514.2 hypothetical protein TTHERM_01135020 [Tetrahymena thermophila SB210]
MTILKLFIASLLVYQIFATPGVDVTCSAVTCTTSGTCPNPPTVPGSLTWQNGGDTGKCAINSCPANTQSGLTGASDLFCQSCPGTTVDGVKAIYANTALTGCVAAIETCGATRAENTWTNSDCLACNGSSSQYAKADKSGCQASPVSTAAGADVTCSDTTCTTSGTCPNPPTVPGSLTWQNGGDTGKCAINSCPANTSSGLTGASDLFCQSCPGTTVDGVKAIYANTALTGCVAAIETCGATRAENTWTNSDCLACNGSSSQYAKADKSGCQASPVSTAAGADVTCSAATCTTSGTCPNPPTAPAGLTWQNGEDTGKCAINSCPANTSSGLTGASDLFCQSCPGTTVDGVKAIYANTALTGCVAAIQTCGATRADNTWTNSDCLACNGSSSQYAKADRSGCQASPVSIAAGADVTCSAATCTTSGTCPNPPTAPAGLNWQNGVVTGKCAINSCPANTSSGLTGASDLFCQSCPGTTVGRVTAVYANTALTGCVAATATCSANRTANTWTNADCLACNGSSSQYAKADKSSCQATAPSSSTNSMIILSSVLFLISFLF